MKATSFIISSFAAGALLLGAVSCACNSQSDQEAQIVKPEAQQVEKDIIVPDGWNTYVMGNAFRISVPGTVELRSDEDVYTKMLKDLVEPAYGVSLDHDKQIVFQQAGLANRTEEAYSRYCRIMIQYIKGNYGDFMKASETEELDAEWRSILREMVMGSIANANLIGEPTYRWVTLNGAKAIQVDYKRQGQNHDSSKAVVCRYYILQNNNEMVKIILSYRESEAHIWKEDFAEVGSTFSWAI